MSTSSTGRHWEGVVLGSLGARVEQTASVIDRVSHDANRHPPSSQPGAHASFRRSASVPETVDNSPTRATVSTRVRGS